MFCQTSVGIGFADLVHFASQLAEQLDADHAVVRRSLEKLGHIANDVAEDKLFLLGIEPTQFCDSGEQGDQTLDDELGQFGLIVQVGKDIVA